MNAPARTKVEAHYYRLRDTCTYCQREAEFIRVTKAGGEVIALAPLCAVHLLGETTEWKTASDTTVQFHFGPRPRSRSHG